jgi:hypothetical protein
VDAAAAPWFMALSGRVSLLTGWMSPALDPNLALCTLLTLACMQARRSTRRPVLPLRLENLSLAGARVDIGVRPDGVSVNGLPPGAQLVGADGRDQSTVIS